MPASIFNKGFRGKRNVTAPERIPPGQYETRDFPVLSAGPTPRVNPQTWSFTIEGLVASPLQLSWADFNALPLESFTRDIHCVTKWSKLGTEFTLRSSERASSGPTAESINLGFRVASVPEPSTYALLAMTAAGALWMARRRR